MSSHTITLASMGIHGGLQMTESTLAKLVKLIDDRVKELRKEIQNSGRERLDYKILVDRLNQNVRLSQDIIAMQKRGLV
jgi:hypothetical protein